MSLLAFTNKPVVTVQPETTVFGAARIMMERCVGALVVSDASGEVARGIVTDRDLLYMISEGLDPKTATVGCFVQPKLETIQVGDGITDATAVMRRHGVRRLPIVDGEGRLVGILSLDDVLTLLGRELGDVAAIVSEELEHERRVEKLRAQIGGGTAQ